MSDTNQAGHASEPALESDVDYARDPRPLKSVIDELLQSGAETIRIVTEDDTGYRYEEHGEVLLDVRAIYDHYGMEERLRRFLDAAGDTVRWQGDELEFEFDVGAESRAGEWTTAYDRFR